MQYSSSSSRCSLAGKATLPRRVARSFFVCIFFPSGADLSSVPVFHFQLPARDTVTFHLDSRSRGQAELVQLFLPSPAPSSGVRSFLNDVTFHPVTLRHPVSVPHLCLQSPLHFPHLAGPVTPATATPGYHGLLPLGLPAPASSQLLQLYSLAYLSLRGDPLSSQMPHLGVQHARSQSHHDCLTGRPLSASPMHLPHAQLHQLRQLFALPCTGPGLSLPWVLRRPFLYHTHMFPHTIDPCPLYTLFGGRMFVMTHQPAKEIPCSPPPYARDNHHFQMGVFTPVCPHTPWNTERNAGAVAWWNWALEFRLLPW